MNKEQVEKIATEVLGFEKQGHEVYEYIWSYEGGWMNHFNPLVNNDDLEKVKAKMREDGWLLTVQDKLDYMGDRLSSAKAFHPKKPDNVYDEALDEKVAICSIALKAYGLK